MKQQIHEHEHGRNSARQATDTCAGHRNNSTGAGSALPLPYVTSILPPLTVPVSSRLSNTRRTSPLALALLVFTSRRGGRANYRMLLNSRGGTPLTSAVGALQPNARRGRHRRSTTRDCTGSAHVHPHPFDRGRPVFLAGYFIPSTIARGEAAAAITTTGAVSRRRIQDRVAAAAGRHWSCRRPAIVFSGDAATSTWSNT